MPVTSDFCYHYLSNPYSTICTTALHLFDFEQSMRNDLMCKGTSEKSADSSEKSPGNPELE